MATLQPSQFCRYEMTELEILQGSALSLVQTQCLQNQLADIASRKLNLVFEPLNPTDFAQQIAWHQGQMDALQHLLMTSEAATLQLNTTTR